MIPLILDSGAVIAETQSSENMRALLRVAAESGQPILVPAGVVVETLRDQANDVLINRLLKRRTVEVSIHNEERARLAGTLLAGASTQDVVDALVVAEAIHQGGGVILTSDPGDISELTVGHPGIGLLAV